MQPIAFCTRCRGMRVGWNARYILHCLTCKEVFYRSYKLLILSALLPILLLAFPIPGGYVFSGGNPEQVVVAEATLQLPAMPQVDPAVTAIRAFLNRYKVNDVHLDRIAEAIVNSSRKYNVDSRLVASIMIVESRANPFAISNSDSIGIMQIHLPTWGYTADQEGINLFKIEDNVDFGVRILKDYTRRFGLWEGVKRYKGWNPESLESAQSVEDYLTKIRRIYAFSNPVASVQLQ